ncbi:Synaptonemal complex protein 1 (SCP-1)-like protein [Dinothrombium tinctorium]|uniref:Synaptonemal complex protein 1 (SCP-1)-like protein n=1 Tax=Dinothrombium tinctorium TaxID=1965070 RepID=A0A3S3S1F5_9ACAR|nr:Synaptonemal complex protein 1 (SCP-1)-like protein [Dinothrombium tinctorium]
MSVVNRSRGLGGEGDKDGIDLGVRGAQSVLESNNVPQEIVALFDEFKRFVKQQKMIKEENSEQRFNVEPILTVDENIKHSLHRIEVDLQNNGKQVELLKKETSKLLNYGEIAYRLVKAEIPSNVYVNKYFLSLIEEFETQMNTYSKQIKMLENHLKNMNKPYSCEELFGILRKQHETLIALAENVYLIHEQVNSLKQKGEKESNIDTFSLFDKSMNEKTASLLGPNPFTKSPAMELTAPPLQQSLGLFSSTSQDRPLLYSGLNLSSSSSTFQPSKNKRWTSS